MLPPFSLNPEDGGIMDLWNFGILPQHNTATHPTKLLLESSPSWKPHNPQI